MMHPQQLMALQRLMLLRHGNPQRQLQALLLPHQRKLGTSWHRDRGVQQLEAVQRGARLQRLVLPGCFLLRRLQHSTKQRARLLLLRQHIRTQTMQRALLQWKSPMMRHQTVRAICCQRLLLPVGCRQQLVLTMKVRKQRRHQPIWISSSSLQTFGRPLKQQQRRRRRQQQQQQQSAHRRQRQLPRRQGPRP